MKKKLLLIAFLFLQMLSWSQDYRYTANLFSASTIIPNVVYGAAPALNGPFYSSESSTSPQNLVMDIYSQLEIPSHYDLLLFSHILAVFFLEIEM